MKIKNHLLTGALFAVSIISTYFAATSSAQQIIATPTPTPTPQTAAPADTEYQVAGILYMQKAAEYRALAYQAFNLAARDLDADAEKKNLKKLSKEERRRPRAVIVDIDETMLDNSPAQAEGAKKRQAFDVKSWYAWGEMRKAKAVPGAVEFANYAKSKNVRIFYITNRDQVQKQATMDNLRAVGFPDITEENVIFRQKESTKEPRRRAVAEKYRVVELIGDNLNDFSDVFEKKSVTDRFAETDKAKNLWGVKFIVLPNAMYGDWESAIYEYQRLSDEQKTQKRADALELP